MSRRPFLAAVLLFAIVLFPPLARWPLAHLPAYAEPALVSGSATAQAQAQLGEAIDGYAVASSNGNERRDQEERRGREDNQQDNDHEDDWTPPPPPEPILIHDQSPPSSRPPDRVEACLQNGETLTLPLPDGGVAVRAFQGGLYLQLMRIDPATVPPPPGSIGEQFLFRLAAAPCGGEQLAVLPTAVNLGVSYRNRLGERLDESKLALLFFDGGTWTTAPGVQADPIHNHVSASVAGLGVYAVVQQ